MLVTMGYHALKLLIGGYANEIYRFFVNLFSERAVAFEGRLWLLTDYLNAQRSVHTIGHRIAQNRVSFAF